MTGIEVWLTGTKDDLRAAWRALHQIGAITQRGELHPIEEAGRYRLYLRLTVTSQQPARPAAPPAHGDGRPVLRVVG